MPSHSPTLEGFRTILRRPSFGFAEISWRWSFGAAAALLLTFSFFEYLDTLPVTRADVLLLKTRQPALVGQAISRIFHGSGVRFVHASLVVGAGLAIAWILVAALARAATVKALAGHFRAEINSDAKAGPWRLSSLVGLNFFRVAAMLAAFVGGLAAFVIAGIASPAKNPSPGVAFLLTMAILLVVWLAWSMMNWFLSLASVFAVIKGADSFGSIAAVIDLCRDHTGSVFAAGTWFGLAHFVAFFLATSVVAFPLGFATVLPPAVVLGGVLVVTILYFAVADFLYMGRLAAYVSMVEFPREKVVAEVPQQPTPGGGYGTARSTSAVDQGELILSDIPLPSGSA